MKFKQFVVSWVFFLMVVASSNGQVPSVNSDEAGVWIGTAGNHGIYYLTLNLKSGELSTPKKVADIGGAGFQGMSPDGSKLYSAATQGQKSGVAAFAIDNGSLSLLNFVPLTDGSATCVSTDLSGNVLLTAQYGGGSVSTFPVLEDGRLGNQVEMIEHGPGSGVHPNQAKPHPHWIGPSPDNEFVMVPDLGQDRIVIYRLDPETAKLTPHGTATVPPGSGPRHMKFHPSGRFAFVLNELTLTISLFAYDPDNGEFRSLQLIEALPTQARDRHRHSAAEIRVHPNGRFVYSSNRGHDSISVFSFDPEKGQLALIQREAIRGSWPRNFNIDPSGRWLLAAGARSNTLSLFEIDQKTGTLTFSRKIVHVPSPICVTFSR